MDWRTQLHIWVEATSEWVKQIFDQSLHIGLSVLAVLSLYKLTNNVTISVSTPALIWGIREYCQWPSHIWWDPYVDWSFQILGLCIGYWLIK